MTVPKQPQDQEPKLYVFRVRVLGGAYAPANARSIWREIEIKGEQTLADLGQAIPLAFNFTDPHMWSFFLSGEAWDTSTEYGLDNEPNPLTGEQAKLAHRIRIRDVPFPGTTSAKGFLYLFDFGDEWHFGVKLLRQGPPEEARKRYPRVVAKHGDAPPQYPEFEDDEEYEEDELDVDGGSDARR
jgi:hypothetical protein